jgi:RHS repeat-associated protein
MRIIPSRQASIIFLLSVSILCYGQDVSSSNAKSGAAIVDTASLDMERLNPDLLVNSTYTDNTKEIGYTPMSSSVTATGGSVVTIPIAVPKGAGDLSPSISLSYNSQAGNSIAGAGFSISGISTITRGAKDIFHDGTAGAIRYQSDDAYYLDGRRLILSSGTAGADGAVYAPEGEALTQVTMHNSSGVIWFEAATTEGMRYEYGKTSASRQDFTLNGSTVSNAWYVSKAEDPLGLTLTYTYQKDQYFLYPQTISYGNGNTVSFEYLTRFDKQPFILGTTQGSMRLILSKIISRYDNTIYRQYILDYISDKIARLSSVTEKDADGNSLNPIQISWYEIGDFSPIITTENVPLATNSTYVEIQDRMFVAGDVTGNGYSDIIQMSSVIEYSINLPGYQEGTWETYAYIYKNVNGTYSGNPLICSFTGRAVIDDWVTSVGIPSLSDIDGDGINDLIVPVIRDSDGDYNGFSLEYVLGKDIKNGSGSLNHREIHNSFTKSLFSVADLNNDAKNDIIIVEEELSNGKYNCFLLDFQENGSSYSTAHLSLPAIPKKLYTADYNHDGLADLMVVYSSGYKIFWNTSGVLSSSTFSDSSSTTGTNIQDYHILQLGDFNGDGVPDYVINESNDNSNIYLAIGNGDGTFNKSLACTISEYGSKIRSQGGCLVYDFDRDGNSDVVLNQATYYPTFSKTYTHWLRSTGTSLTVHQTSSSNQQQDGAYGRVFFGDFRGIGYPELMNYGNDCYNGVNATGSPLMRLYKSGYASDGKLGIARGSLGNYIKFNYASLADTTYYAKGTGCSYPLLDVSAPLCVTTRHEENGRSRAFFDNYTYGGLKAHLQGRGIIGFEQVSVKHNIYTTITTTMSGWNSNTRLVPTHTQKVTSCDGYTSSSVTDLSLKLFGNNYMLYPSTQVDTDMYNHQTTTTYSYNQDIGYPLLQRTTYDSNDMYRQTTWSDYTYKGRAYRPQTVINSQKHEDDANAYSHTTKLTYNNNGLPTTKIDLYGTSKALTHTYTYDTYGNVLSERLTGSDADITHSYQYDSGGKRIVGSQTTPASVTIQYTYDSYGNLQEEMDVTDSSSPIILRHHHYDGLGNQTSYGSLNGFSPSYILHGWGSTAYEKYYTLERCQGYPWKKTWYDTNGRVSKIETVGPKSVPVESMVHRNENGQPTYKYYRNGTVTAYENLSYDHLYRLQSHVSSTGKTATYTYGDRSVTRTENGRTYTTTYDAWGNVKSSSDPVSSVTYAYSSNGKPCSVSSENNTVYMDYDVAGNQTSLSDPDAGALSYEYDVLGRLKRQTDARGIETAYTYDAADRVTQKTVGNVATTYTYGTSGYGTNCLTSLQTGDRSIAYTYGGSRKVVGETRSMNGISPMTFEYEYNGDLLQYVTYPNDFWIENNHDGFGYNQSVNLTDGTNVWYLDSSDGEDDVIKIGGTLEWVDDPYAEDPEMQNDPIYSFYGQEYLDVPDPVMTQVNDRNSKGFLTSSTLNMGQTTVSQFSYSHDFVTGNLLSRSGMLSQQETFGYDNLDRLTSVSLGGTPQTAVTYDNKGNITNKTGLGNYYYPSGNVRPHAVTGIQNASGLPSTTGQIITYNALGKVASITEGNWMLEITYGPDEQRWKSVLKNNGNVVRTTVYAGNYERVTVNGTTTHYCYMDGGAVNMAEDNDTEGTTYYMVTDNLGSITKLVDLDGNVDFEASYDAWGRQTLASGNTITFHRGYTGHEMLPEFHLINMNGRMYDPILGRFLSPDNYVQMPNFSQSFNRYSYCLNNPLKFNDPSGEIFGWDDVLIIAGALIGGYLGGVSMNQGELNPLKWDYSEPFTYLGIGFGALAGGITGSVIAGSPMWGLNFSVETSYLTGGVTLGATATSGLKYGFHWTTAGGGGGSISNMGSPDKNVENAINKARKDEYDYRQWLNDYNNMIGDISNGLRFYGEGTIKQVSSQINSFSNAVSYCIGYGNIAYKGITNHSLSIEEQRQLFTISGGNIGANIMGTSFGIYAASLASEIGPMGIAYFGALGVSSGRYLGRGIGSIIGGYLFDKVYLPIYIPVLRVNSIKKQLREEIEYNKQFLPDYWNIPPF